MATFPDSTLADISTACSPRPVDNGNKIVGTHFRLKDGAWNYFPKGINAAPLVFGELVPGERVQVCESTFDGLDYMDKSGERDGVIITRGSGNTKFVTDLATPNCRLFLWTQNDALGEKRQHRTFARTRKQR